MFSPSSGRYGGAVSIHAELFLQARRGCRVLERQPLTWKNIVVDFLRRQRALVEAAQNEFQLARIVIDIADRENAGDIGLEGSRIDRNEVLVQVQSPTGNRTELHREPEKRDQTLAGDFVRSAGRVLEGHAGELARFTGQGGNLAKAQIDPPGGGKLPHGLDRMRRGAKIV